MATKVEEVGSIIEHMLSTSDNPWNPFTHYNEWLAWDLKAGYHTQSLQARVVTFPYDASEADQSLAIEYGLQEIVEELGNIKNTDGDPLYILVPNPDQDTEP